MNPVLIEIESGEYVHAYGCLCKRCGGIIQAITAKWPDGSYVFTEFELLQIVMMEPTCAPVAQQDRAEDSKS